MAPGKCPISAEDGWDAGLVLVSGFLPTKSWRLAALTLALTRTAWRHRRSVKPKRSHLSYFGILSDEVQLNILMFLDVESINTFQRAIGKSQTGFKPELFDRGWRTVAELSTADDKKFPGRTTKAPIIRLHSGTHFRDFCVQLEFLRNFQGKLLLAAGLAAYLETHVPFHFFEQLEKIPWVISFNSVVGESVILAEGIQRVQIEWQHLAIICNGSNGSFEWVVLTGSGTVAGAPRPGGYDRLEISDSRTIVITHPLPLIPCPFDVAAQLLEIPRLLKAAALTPLLLVGPGGVECPNGVDKVRNFQVRCGVSLDVVVDKLRVRVGGESQLVHENIVEAVRKIC